jgi:serine phosphatase RsbU (regulator of sigma subunit)
MSQQLDVPSHYNRAPGSVSAQEKLQALLQITRALSETVRQNEILSKILDCVFDLFTEADRGFIVMKTSDDGELKPLAMKTRTPRHEEQIRISRTIAKQVMDTKRPMISSDAATDSRFDMSQSVADFRIRSMMCAPLINSKDESLGVIQLDTLKKSIAFSQEDLELLVSVAMQASLAIQKADLYEDAKRSDGLHADLKLAHELQLRFLPERNPDIDRYDFFSFYRPMQQVGGDYYDYVQLDEHRTGIIVADVVGHGIAAAMMMAKVSAESRFALATTQSPVEAVRKMNKSLSNMNVDRFVTLVLGVLDTRTHTINIVNAGHMPPILRKGNLGEISLLPHEESGLPLGVLEDAEFTPVELKLDPGDTLIMYTDGINEAMDSEGEQFTIKRMVDDIEESQTRSPETIGNLLCQSVFRHIGNEPAIDDMCLVCIGRQADSDD